MYQELKLLYDWRIYMISSVVNRTRLQRNDFCLLWIVVVENSTSFVHHVQKPLNLSHTSSESHDLLFYIDLCIRNFNCSKIDWLMWFHLKWTEVVDNVTTSVYCEQMSLKTQPVLSIMYTNLWTCLILVQKAVISCFKIDLCIRNSNWY